MEKILFIKANPIDTENLRLENEENKIREALARSNRRLNFSFDSRGAVTKESLLDHLLEVRPSILHVSGHGNSENSLFLEDNEGFKEEVSIEKFTNLIGNFLDHIHCVFLNACHSLSEMNEFNNQIPHIIGMKSEISDEVAIGFSTSFYKSLFSGKTIRESFKIALDIISLTSFDDELIPKLIEYKTRQDSTEHSNQEVTNNSFNEVDRNLRSSEIKQMLVSEEEIDMIKNQKINKVNFYKLMIIIALLLACCIGFVLYFKEQGLLISLISSMLSVFLGIPPFYEVKKNQESIDLVNLYKLKRKRLLKAIVNISNEDIKKFNDEFYLRVTL